MTRKSVASTHEKFGGRLDVHPQRLEHLAAGRLALDARDRREGSRARHRLEEANALLLLRRRGLLATSLGGANR